MKKSLATALLTLSLIGLGTGSALAETSVSLDEFNSSGISGSATFNDDGSVTATASGMDPNKEYYSFYYGAGSDSTGANPCILTGETGAGPNNTIGEWEVDESGNGTLSGNSFGSTESAGTMSIRENDLGTNGALGPNPADTLVACGEVGPEQDTPLGDVQDQVPQLPNGDDPLGTGQGDVTENPVDTDAVEPATDLPTDALEGVDELDNSDNEDSESDEN